MLVPFKFIETYKGFDIVRLRKPYVIKLHPSTLFGSKEAARTGVNVFIKYFEGNGLDYETDESKRHNIIISAMVYRMCNTGKNYVWAKEVCKQVYSEDKTIPPRRTILILTDMVSKGIIKSTKSASSKRRYYLNPKSLPNK